MARSSSGLWAAWQSTRDEAAFETLVRPELPALYDVARRTGLGSHDAEDVVQDALSELARESSQRPGQVGVGAWLMRAVRLKALGRGRSSRRRKKYEERIPARQVSRPDAELEVHDEVERALDKLDDADRQILLFRFLYDLDYREIAYVLGVSENACRIRVHRASARLRERVGHRAPAMIALLPLCDLPNTAGAVAAATKTAATGTGTWAALTGGMLMGTGVKMVGAAAAAAALTAGAFLTLQDSEPPLEPDPIETVVAEAPTPSASGAPSLDVRTRKAIADLNPTDEELAWMKARLREERSRVAKSKVRDGDSGIDILARVIDHGLDPWPLMADFTEFAGHVRTGEGSARTFYASGSEPTKLDIGPALRGGTRVIEFGPGTFELTFGRFRQREPIESLEFRGAGKDDTILLMGSYDELMVRKQMTNLRFTGMTLDYRGQRQMLDVRDSMAAVLEDVRVRNWSGGGYSAAIGVAGRAYLGCRDCEFEHSEGRGGRFAVNFRGPGVAVFERCTFRDVQSAVMGDGNAKGSQVLLKDCQFFETRLTDSRVEVSKKQPSLEIRVRGGRALFGEPQWKSDVRRERWGAQYAAELTDFALEASNVSLTASELAGILRTVDLPHQEFLHNVQATRFRDGTVQSLQLCTHIDGQPRPKVYYYTRGESGWVLKHHERGGGMGYHMPDQFRPRDIISLLESDDVPPNTQVRGIGFNVMNTLTKDGENLQIPMVSFGGDPRAGKLPVMINAETGKRFDPLAR